MNWIGKLKVKAKGQTVNHQGEVVLAVDGDMPPDCMVVFISMEVWNEIKDKIEVEE